MIIMKFGGRTLATAERIKSVSKLIRKKLPQKPVLIISALGGITDQLEESARLAARTPRLLSAGLIDIREKHLLILKQLGLPAGLLDHLFRELEVAFRGVSLLKELTPRTLDYILSFGERCAARLVASYLRKEGLPAQAFDAFQIGLKTDSNFGNARILPESTLRIRKNLRGLKELPVITGFIGKDRKGEVTTLGRDGSDYTASFIGAALGAKEIQIWRDLPGVMTADPATVNTARLVEHITLEEASELVYYGNGVLHPYMLAPAVDKGIPVRILNIFQPESTGTLILHRPRNGQGVKTIACKKEVILVNVVSPEIFHHRRLAIRVFETLARYGIFFHLLASSEISISFATVPETPHLAEALKEISSFARVESFRDKSIICIIGEGIKYHPKIIADIFGALARARIKTELVLHDALKTNLTLMVSRREVNRTVKIIHNLLFN